MSTTPPLRRSLRLQTNLNEPKENKETKDSSSSFKRVKQTTTKNELALKSRASAPGLRVVNFGFLSEEVRESPEYDNFNPKRSSMEISADLNVLDSLKGFVVVPRAELGNGFKAAVMQIASPEEPPRFSKYGGLQTFRNAFLLFINVGCATYENAFQINEDNKELLLSWFAQDRHDLSTPVIRRLCYGETPVYGFLRAEGGPYYCCGKLKRKGWNDESRPLKLIFEVSYDLLSLPKPNRLKQLLRLHASLQEEGGEKEEVVEVKKEKDCESVNMEDDGMKKEED